MSQGNRAYEQLREEIVSWRLPPGTHLNETKLAERLGVSRTPLREAVQRLARDNLVRITPGRGAFVTDIAVQDVVNLFQMREALETYAARLCARNEYHRPLFTQLELDFQGQRAQIESALPDEDNAEYYTLIARMDKTIDDSLNNPHLLDSLASLRGQLRRLRQLARRKPTRMLETVAEHATICHAIADGNEELAARTVSLHINNSLRNTLATLADRVGIPVALVPEHGIID